MDHDVRLAVRAPLADPELNALFSAAWPDHRHTDFQPVLARSLTWISAHRNNDLVGFVNVATDGGVHAFVLDTTVHPDVQRQGIGRRLLRAAIDEARVGGALWMHVDYEPHLDGFYRGCGFRSTTAGVLRLDRTGGAPAGTR